MADFDPDAYLAAKKKQGATDPHDTVMGAVTDFGKGVAEGFGGDVVGAGQIAQAIAPSLAEDVKELPGVRAGAHWLKEKTTGDSASAAESIGRFGGGALPMLAMPETAGAGLAARALPYLGRAAGPLTELAMRSLQSGVSAGIQPTKSGTLASHVEPALEGAAAGVAIPGAGKVAGKIARSPFFEHAMQHTVAGEAASAIRNAMPLPHWLGGGLYGLPLYFALRNTPLARLAARGLTGAGKTATRQLTRPTASTLAGTGIGQVQEGA